MGGLALLATSAGGLLSGCSGGDPDAGRGVELVSAGTPRSAADPTLIAPTVEGMDAFAARLYAAVAGQQQGNLVISPYSVAAALSMTLAGARGRTAQQLSGVLGAIGLGGRWHDGVNALTSYVDSLAGERQRADGTTVTLGLRTADAVFGQRGVPWQHDFLEMLAKDYGTGVRAVDFTDPEPVRRLINAWVADATDHRIEDLIPSGVLDPGTRLALVNAISLTAPWDDPFEHTATSDGPFHLAGGGVRKVPMMHRTGQLEQVEGSGWSGVRLRYAGGALALTVVLPDPGRLSAVEVGLAGGGLATALGPGRTGPVELSLPKWSSRTALSLAEVLAGLGAGDAFDPGRADFSGMTRAQRLYLSAVLHQGRIEVDEHGTEAAAATAAVMTVGAAPVRERPTRFVVDRPFLYAVHDVAHGTPLFLGRVTDPTAEGGRA
ncbi:serpin family protein [Nocardioides montaniterrae]